jgi:hypothetical protein
MPAGKTYSSIATTTLSSSSTTVTFSSIPATYTDLVVVTSPLGVGEELVLQFNGDTSSVYSSIILWGNGSVAGSYRSFSLNSALLNYYAPVGSSQSVQIINVMNYANATTYKNVISRASAVAGGTESTAALWQSTAAINSMTFKQKNGGNFTTGSIFTLYGIAAA